MLKEGRSVEDHLKELMKELGNAINESLSESDRISSVIEEIRDAGYEVFLVLEATIGFSKAEPSAKEEDVEPAPEIPETAAANPQSATRIRWTSHDQKFLRALKIAVDDDRLS